LGHFLCRVAALPHSILFFKILLDEVSLPLLHVFKKKKKKKGKARWVGFFVFISYFVYLKFTPWWFCYGIHVDGKLVTVNETNLTYTSSHVVTFQSSWHSFFVVILGILAVWEPLCIKNAILDFSLKFFFVFSFSFWNYIGTEVLKCNFSSLQNRSFKLILLMYMRNVVALVFLII
jgi:hypothetical protein